jgi:hypothetical protein
MRAMNYNTIKRLQKEHGFDGIQRMINDGSVWKLEGSYGRYAVDLLNSGACLLPKTRHRDFYGNLIPSRDDVQAGTTGSLHNSYRFYERIEEGLYSPEFD